jgi:hypothetical protein
MSLGGSHSCAGREITKHHRAIGFRECAKQLTPDLYRPNTCPCRKLIRLARETESRNASVL